METWILGSPRPAAPRAADSLGRGEVTDGGYRSGSGAAQPAGRYLIGSNFSQ